MKNKNGDWMFEKKKLKLPKEGETGYIIDESTNKVLGLQHSAKPEDKNWRSRTVVALEDLFAG